MSTGSGDTHKRSLFALIGSLPTLLIDLAKGEIESFKNELVGKAKHAGIGIGLLAAAATFAYFALLVLIATAILGIAVALPPWLAALIVGVAILLIAVILALLGIRTLKQGVPPTPTDTIVSVKQDVRVIKGTGKRVEP